MAGGQRRRNRFPRVDSEAVIDAWITAQLRDREPLPPSVTDTLSLLNERWTAFTEGRRPSLRATGISWTIHGWRVQVMRSCQLRVKSFPKAGPVERLRRLVVGYYELLE